MDKHRESIGNALLWSMVPAACVIVVVTLIMLGDWEGVSWWYYPASWVNAVSGFYCWVALWLGVYLRSHRPNATLSGSALLECVAGSPQSVVRHARPSGPTLSSRLLWETQRGTLTILLPAVGESGEAAARNVV